MRVPRADDIEKAPDRVARLRALALQAHQAGQIKYAELLEQQALRTASEPDGFASEESLRLARTVAKYGSVGRKQK